MRKIESGSAEERFVHELGIALEREGLSPIAGRLLAWLLLAERPLSFAELSDHLGASRASISGNTRMMMTMGLLRRVRVPGSNQMHYMVNERPLQRMVEGQRARNQRSLEAFEIAQRDIPDLSNIAMVRLQEFISFYRAADAIMDDLLKAAGGNGKAS